jgi:uncharacterized SAM-binding protein YcdF (DUF218 family)
LVFALLVWLVTKHVWPKSRRFARVYLAAILIAYVTLSVPWVASSLADALEPLPTHWEETTFDVLVVLDGDNRAGRSHEAMRAWKHARLQPVYVLGEDLFLEDLIAAGFSRDQLRLVVNFRTTRDQIGWLRRRAAEQPSDRVGLVVSRVHRPRVEALAKAAHLEVTMLSAPLDAEPARSGIWRYVPGYAAMCVSHDALYEHVALMYYRWRGWIVS